MTPLTFFVRTLFLLRSRRWASRLAETQLALYLEHAHTLAPEQGRRVVEVPPMPGVDENMRRWSYFMLLEHNTLVNRSITAVTAQLARGEELHGLARINPKTDVLPSSDPGPEAVAAFEASVRDHLETVAGLGRLRRTATAPHPLFGDFDAHQWHCMFGLHLKIHNRQADVITSRLRTHAPPP